MKSPFIGLGLFFALLFLLVPEKFSGPDSPIYPAYILSVVQDGDLNLINNLHPPTAEKPCALAFKKVEVTPTYNTPDFHNHGALLFWIPFYYYGETMKSVLTTLFPEERYPELGTRIAVSAISFSTVALAFFASLFTYLLAAHFFRPGLAFWSLMAVFWGSPAFLYTIFEPGNANIPALFLGSVLLLATASLLTSPRRLPPLILGLLFAICIVVKLDLWFLSIFIGLSFLCFWYRGQTTLTALFWFALGLAAGSLPKPINDFLKYGSWHAGEAGLLNFQNSYHFEQLFSPYQGYFSTSPILVLCLLALPFLGWQFITHRPTDKKIIPAIPGLAPLLLIMTAWLVAKLTAIGFRFAWGGGTFGARQLITELPFFVLLLAFLLHQLWASPRTWLRPLAVGLLLLLIGANWLYAGEYLAQLRIDYFLLPANWPLRFTYLWGVGPKLKTALLAMPLKLHCLPLFALFLWLASALLGQREAISALLTPWAGKRPDGGAPAPARVHTILTVATLLMVAGYSWITLLNLVNNQANVAEMGNAGCFEEVRVIEDGKFESGENSVSLKEMTYYFWKKGDKERALKLQILQQHLYPDPK